MERLISFALISLLHLLHVQLLEPASRSTAARAFVCHISLNYIIAKYLKHEVDDGSSVCVDKRRPCCFSVTGDIKIYSVPWSNDNDVTSHNGEVPHGLLSRSCYYLPHLPKSRIYKVMMSLAPEAEYPMEPFEWGLPAVKILMFLEISRFSN